jgi:DNA-directed RNA polymerase subunit RPC12/RpoP
MKVSDQQAEAVRCPECALIGIASRTNETAKIKRLPEWFKVVTTDKGDQIYCAACNRPAITLIIDP